ncbi:RNA polymerase, sigma-24 subunit, ECF subfamily [Chthoniobacter flavus Ellin428]|uniref:RNA polymerase, sigma-24 subunit, ECF subfamily n=1 Tax=Chthoniobacter flavus Ellin428 TaxID=497964 RepID=B4D255_9BACT|nr:sigma-70 family RNA polymerase sigma factor [Chthoniobacter flavus]EDY19295.1 RNA polymerase, sigma-24 subunit, ECF subfamily [Chthoniobacter flavus Ellin428]TCO90572.1 RNA polymerase sigma-70 factor (ECF subfamily) [Chthoniobacter flavus]
MTTEPRPALDDASFHTTRWTRVCLAKADSDDGRKALADLCAAYYAPVMAFLRCELRDAEAARELSHAFFAGMLAGGTIRTAEEERGRFRSYLLGAVKHFLSHHRAAALRMKRGGGVVPVPMDDEAVGALPDPRQLSPDAAFDRQWALTVLSRGLDALRAECRDEGREDFFERVKPLLTGDGEHGGQAEIAEACGMGLEAFRMAMHRLKKRLRQCVKAEVAGTLDDPTRVQEEMEALFAALGS